MTSEMLYLAAISGMGVETARSDFMRARRAEERGRGMVGFGQEVVEGEWWGALGSEY